MKDALIVSALSVLPRKRGARSMGWFARTKASKALVRWFVRAYKLDMSEATEPLSAYPTLEALFTRRLKPGARPVDGAPEALVSPVDGTVAFVGPTVDGCIEVADGKTLDLSDLLATSLDGERDVIVLYLSPRDYHRVHVPREGRATHWRYVPGTLWPVFPAAVRRVEGLFARNERVVITVDTSAGPLEVVLVGAFGVGRITVEVCQLVTNSGGKPTEGALAVDIERGEELGVFHLGSTVVLAGQPGRWAPSIEVGATVRVGEKIGALA